MFPLEYVLGTEFLCSGNQASKKKHLLELIERRSKVCGKNISRERALSFDQLKAFSEYCKPMRD